MTDLAWYALRIRTRFGAIAVSHLVSRGYEVFHPTYPGRYCSVGCVKRVPVPLFPGYLFCQFRFDQRLSILTAPGVISVVAHGKQPAPIGEHEIANIRTLVKAQYRLSPCEYLNRGDQARIVGGPLNGMEGILLRSKGGGDRLVLSITLLARSVAVEVDRDNLCPIATANVLALQAGTTPLPVIRL